MLLSRILLAFVEEQTEGEEDLRVGDRERWAGVDAVTETNVSRATKVIWSSDV